MHSARAIGALLRREGLYSSLLVEWRRARGRGRADGPDPEEAGASRPVGQVIAVVTVPSLSPRRRGVAASARLRRSLLPSRGQDTLGLRGLALSRLPLRSLTLRPGHSLTILPMASSMGSRALVSLRPAIQATGRLALVPVGLSPTEHVCLWIAPCPSSKPRPPAASD